MAPVNHSPARYKNTTNALVSSSVVTRGVIPSDFPHGSLSSLPEPGYTESLVVLAKRFVNFLNLQGKQI